MASLNEKVRQHAAVCNELNALFARKNADYGDAFHTSFLDEGLAMAVSGWAISWPGSRIFPVPIRRWSMMRVSGIP